MKLRYLDDWNIRRMKIAAFYSESLAEIPGLVLPYTPVWAFPVWHIYPVRCKKRDEFQKFLKNQGVETIIHYPVPPHLSKAYEFPHLPDGSFPIAEEIAATELSLPISPHMGIADAQFVVETVRNFFP